MTSERRSDAENARVGGAKDSDHLIRDDGRMAYDIGARGDKRTQIARDIAARYGIKFRPNAISEGVIRVGGKAYRVQVIEGPAVDHDDHVHVGIRPV